MDALSRGCENISGRETPHEGVETPPIPWISARIAMYLMHVYLLHLLPLHVSKVLTAAGLSDTFCRTYCAYGTDSCIYPLLLSQELYNGEYCSTYVGKQDTQGRKHIPRAGGGQFLIPGRETLPFKWKPKTAGTQPPPPPRGGGTSLNMLESPLSYRGLAAMAGIEQPILVRAHFPLRPAVR